MSESEDRHRRDKFEYTVGLLVLDKDGPFADKLPGEVRVELALFERFFNAGWEWAKSWKDYVALNGAEPPLPPDSEPQEVTA